MQKSHKNVALVQTGRHKRECASVPILTFVFVNDAGFEHRSYNLLQNVDSVCCQREMLRCCQIPVQNFLHALVHSSLNMSLHATESIFDAVQHWTIYGGNFLISCCSTLNPGFRWIGALSISTTARNSSPITVDKLSRNI